MSEPKWTPRPWAVGNTGYPLAVIGGDASVVCSGKAGQDANAYLIAAAPEMYAVLDKVERSMRTGQWEKVEDVRAEIRAVCAKARGETEHKTGRQDQ